MTAEQAIIYNNSLKKVSQITQEEWLSIEPLKVDYNSLEEYPDRVKERINLAIKWIVDKYKPPYIDLVMSHVNGYPIFEDTSQELFNAKKNVLGKAKISDYDFIVPTLPKFQIIEIIHPLIKVDMFKKHHNGVKTIRVYKKL